MPDILKGILIFVLSLGLSIGASLLLFTATGLVEASTAIIIGSIFGFLYGLEAAILLIYDLNSPLGWLLMVIDTTWSLPNTVFGFVLGNIIYIFFGTPSRADSEGEGWIVFQPRSATGFGNDVLQTLGNLNLGGRGQHEKMHLLQARIFGPLYLPIFALNYTINFLIQCLWSITIGMILWKAGTRTTPYFRPASNSAVSGFWGWIYWANLFELWAYASGNP